MTSAPHEAAAISGIQTLAGYQWISFTGITIDERAFIDGIATSSHRSELTQPGNGSR
jgi:hypothetical protein